MSFAKNKIILVVGALAATIGAYLFATHERTVDFSSEVKPILNKQCISCHGGVKAKGGFSLLFRHEALAKTESGKPAIVPGKPGESDMIRRLTLKDPEERMPYQHAPLSKEDIKTLTLWVKQGARWGDHWAYLPVQQGQIPGPKTSLFSFFDSDDDTWPQGSIDRFIYDRLAQEGLKFSAEAPKASLLRRASLDITGMPASDQLSKRFLNSTTGDAYAQLVDSLLASPHYGERWAAVWLDIARYADTKGYERDDSRGIWKYRDWLIDAFNKDKPYKEFLVEQLAGDLMPNATDEQLVATAFHRNTMTNDEGGTDNEEFRTAAVMDRVNSTWEGLMGTTFACVQCHSHPYDPFTHEEYYKFLAFFNNTRDEDTWKDYPLLRHHTGSDSLKLLAIKAWLRNNGYPQDAEKVAKFLKTWQPAIYSLRADSFINSELSDTKWLAMRNKASARLQTVDMTGKDELIFRYQAYVPGGVWIIRLDKKDGPVLKTIPLRTTQKGTWIFDKVSLPPQAGVHNLYFSYSSPSLQNPLQSGVMFDWFHFSNSLPGKHLAGYDSIAHWVWELTTKVVEPTTPIMQDNPADMARTTHVFDRGNWLVKGKKVDAAVPASLNPWPKGAPRNRLGMALWLTDKKNPLTARTMVNRVWEQIFGVGLVETLEDMGTQGAEPTHRLLLDHLAYRFMYEMKWSVKSLVREIMLSQTYRQDTKVSPELKEKDPINKLYARSSRVRLSAEALRDQALAASGLLSKKMMGPSVMPWQPGGIWLSPWNGAEWKRSEGEDAYRRAIYTFWKRTAPYPAMITYDGVGREVCTPRRIRTNTPLQALATLNDSVFLEASRHLAQRMEKQAGGVAQQINVGYERLLYRPIDSQKLAALMQLYNQALAQYKKDRAAARKMTAGGDDRPERAALIVVANAMLNLDEIVTKS